MPSLRMHKAMHRLAIDHEPDAYTRAHSDVSDRGLGGRGGVVGELGQGGSVDVGVEEDGLGAVCLKKRGGKKGGREGRRLECST